MELLSLVPQEISMPYVVVDYYEERFHRRTLDNLRRRTGALGFSVTGQIA